MKKTLKNQFVNENHSFNTEKAIEAGHEARTVAIKEFAAWFLLAIKVIGFRGETHRI